MNNNPFIVVILLLICSGANIHGQKTSVFYDLSYKSDAGQRHESYRLDIDGQKSIFRTIMRRASDSMQDRTGYGLGYNEDPFFELYFLKDALKHDYKKYFVLPLSRDRFFVNITDELKWEILPDLRKIEKFDCQKARVNYGGRNWTAWFSTQIPVSEGPYYFHGLPGLIVQMQDGNDEFFFQITEIKKITPQSLFEIKNGTELTWKQYDKILLDYFQNPYASIRNRGMKVVTDDGRGGYREIDYHDRLRDIQKIMLRNDNPIELNHKVNFH